MMSFLTNKFQKIKKSLSRQRGATLIELLVVIVTSAIILSVVLGSFASLIRVTQKLDTSRQMQKEINFALMRIADKMRAHSIDYGAYEAGGDCASISQPSSTKLCLGRGHIFKKEENNLYLNSDPLFSKGFQVREAFFFYVSPENKSDPYQPKVTVYLDLVSEYFPEITFQIQTTLSSRQYQ